MHSLIVFILSVAPVAPALAWDDDGFIITGKAAFPG